MSDTFKFKPKTTGLKSLLDKQDQLVPTAKKIEQARPEIKLEARPEDAQDKIRIVFDDSGSMGTTQIKNAQDGCIELLRNCIPNQVAVSIHPMNKLDPKLSTLTVDLPKLSQAITTIQATDSTPLYETLNQALNLSPTLTRAIVFSDGSPDEQDKTIYHDKTIALAQQMKVPVDTVLIAYNTSPDANEYVLLKELADKTGGYFLVFDRNKVNFKDAFKYLSPKLRLALSDGNVRQQLQDGKLS